jgi:hypothetical protein
MEYLIGASFKVCGGAFQFCTTYAILGFKWWNKILKTFVLLRPVWNWASASLVNCTEAKEREKVWSHKLVSDFTAFLFFFPLSSGVLNVSQRLMCVVIVVFSHHLLSKQVLGQNTERYVLCSQNDWNILWHFQYNFVDLVWFCHAKFVAGFDLSVNHETGG